LKTIEINESARSMKLNMDNRVKFKNIILNDVLFARSNAVREGMVVIQGKFIDLTYGSTPQKRAAVKKRMIKMEEDAKAINALGVSCTSSTGSHTSSFNLNLAGSAITLYFWEEPLMTHTVGFNNEFLKYSRNETSNGRAALPVGSSKLTLVHGDPLIQKFWDLKYEAEAIELASEELSAVLSTVFGRAKTLGAAIDKWPELSQYVPAIMSSCKEIVVPVGTLNKRLDVLRSGKGKVADAMKAEA
jgi:hypothetical protein